MTRGNTGESVASTLRGDGAPLVSLVQNKTVGGIM